MILYPDVQRRAHAELDKVVGMDRLPDLDDQSELPYMTAIMREVLRSGSITLETRLICCL